MSEKVNRLPWNERVTMLAINPDAATRDDVARLAAEPMEALRGLNERRESMAPAPEEKLAAMPLRIMAAVVRLRRARAAEAAVLAELAKDARAMTPRGG